MKEVIRGKAPHGSIDPPSDVGKDPDGFTVVLPIRTLLVPGATSRRES